MPLFSSRLFSIEYSCSTARANKNKGRRKAAGNGAKRFRERRKGRNPEGHIAEYMFIIMSLSDASEDIDMPLMKIYVSVFQLRTKNGSTHKRFIVVGFILLVVIGCHKRKDWSDSAVNPCSGMKIKIGSMGDSDAGRQLQFLLKRQLHKFGFVVVSGQEREEATLIGVTSISGYIGSYNQAAFQGTETAPVTAELTNPQGEELWSGFIKPNLGPSLANTLDWRAAEIAKRMVKSCSIIGANLIKARLRRKMSCGASGGSLLSPDNP